jgi:hypothetical protein
MKLLKTMVSLKNQGIVLCDTIEHEGELWLVPEWIDGVPKEGYSKPARIICLTSLRHGGGFGKADFVLNDPIPKDIWTGLVPPESATPYTMIESPDITVLTPTDDFVQ